MTSDRSHETRDELANDRFAQAARTAHAASLQQLSPQVRAQLTQRRRAATAPRPRSAVRGGWSMWAWGSAVGVTLAVGFFVLRGADDTVATGTPRIATTASAPIADRAEDATRAPAIAATETIDRTTEGPTNDTTYDPANDATNDAARDPSLDALIDDLLADEPLSEDALLAAEFDASDADIGFDSLQETPDFYVWLGSQQTPADVTESL